MEIITSRQNRHVVGLCKLLDRSEREKRRTFRFDGSKLLKEAVRAGIKPIAVYCTEKQFCNVSSLVDSDVPIFILADDLMAKVSEEHAPDGVIVEAPYLSDRHVPYAGALTDTHESVVFLESVRDPANLGAIIRCAAAFGVQKLILSRDCADLYNSKTVRASMGAVFFTDVELCTDLPSAVRDYVSSDRRVFAAALDKSAVTLDDYVKCPGDCVIIGNEGHGLSPDVIAAASASIYIPVSDRVESLNAAVAAGILIYEFFRL